MRVLLVCNATKQAANEAMQVVSGWLAEQQIEFDRIISERLVINDPMLAEWMERVDQYDLVVSFGGDGTILRVTRMIGDSDVPLLAFNFGGRGFLASAQVDHLLEALSCAIAGKAVYSQRGQIRVEISYSDGSTRSFRALNEVVVSRLDTGRIVCLELCINDQRLHEIRGDGLLVSSTTGSTAYALSAGGPLVHPSYRGMVVVPISEHSLKSWSIVTGVEDVVTIRPSVDNAQQLVVFLDGEQFGSRTVVDDVAAGNVGVATTVDSADAEATDNQNDLQSDKTAQANIVKVTVRSSNARLRLVHFDQPDFYQQIAAAFFGGADA